MTPQNPGAVDYTSTRGIQVDVGLPDAISENRAESPLYGELYPNTISAYTCPKQSNIYNMYLIWPLGPITLLNIHADYESNYYPIVTRVNMFYSHTTYIKMKSILIHVYIKATTRLSSNPRSLGRAVSSHTPCTCKKGDPTMG